LKGTDTILTIKSKLSYAATFQVPTGKSKGFFDFDFVVVDSMLLMTPKLLLLSK
jgi:hypothetical protein